MKQKRIKYVVAIPKSVLSVATTLTLVLFASIYPIIQWKPVFGSPDTLTLRPDAAGTYQAWGTFGAPSSHWEGTSDQNEATGVQSPAGDATAKEMENLQDTSQTGTINSVTAYVRAKATGGNYLQVTFVSAGAGAATTTTTPLNVPFPSGLQANDLLLMQITVRDTTNAPTTPSGWTLLYGPDSTGTGRQWIFSKLATGSETGNQAVAVGTVNIVKIGRMYAFRNVATSSFTEGGGFGTGTDSSIEAQSVTTTGVKRLAVSFVFVNDDNAVGSFTGETGGDWTEAVAEFTTTAGSDGCIQLQSATMASAGTISGGSYTMGAADPWGARAFALTPIDPAEQAVIVWRTYNTDYESSAITISRTTFTDYSQQRTTNPNTDSAWTWTEVNALEMGGRASTVGASEYIQVSEFWIIVNYTLGFNLNLRVRDWDLTDSIQGAFVYKDSDIQVSDANGWANWTFVSGTVQIKVSYYGFWVDGTFPVTMDSDKTIDVQCKLYDVTVLVQEGVQNAYLASANVTVYNSTSAQGNKITSGVTGNNGQVQLLNLPNNTLTFTQYGGSSYSLVIGNTTQLVSSENQTVTLTADQNSVGSSNSYSIIAFAGVTVPLKGAFAKRRLKKKRRKMGAA